MSDWLDMHALADGQLDGKAKSEAERAAGDDAHLKAEYEAVHSLKRVLSKVESADCSSAWSSCVRRLNDVDRAEKVTSFVGRYAWGLCSIFIVVILGAAVVNRMNPSRLAAGDLAYMASGLSPLGGSTSPQRVLEEFGAVKPLVAPERLTVLGAAKGFFNGSPAVRYDLQDGNGAMMLIITRGEGVIGCEQMESSCYQTSRVGNGYLVTWCDGGYTMALIGDRNPDALCSAADQLRTTR